MQGDILWQPSEERRTQSNLYRFALTTQARHGCEADDYDGLHRWSIADPGGFWSTVWDTAGVIGSKGDRALGGDDSMLGRRFFPGARLNFAENLLRRTGPDDAIVYRAEDQLERRMSWDQLRAQVSQLQQAFAADGLRAGDTVVAMLPGLPEAIVAMLATASLGAKWASCSPDFGVQGALDRFGQDFDPRLLLVADGYWYNGKRIELAEKAAAIAVALRPKATIVVPHISPPAAPPDSVSYPDYIAPWAPALLAFERFPFAQPLYVAFSSGTTGLPKCIVHSSGGVLLQHLKEHRLHCDIRPGDRVFYFTTLGWMMWNWLASGLSAGATLCLYDGSPFHPHPGVLFDYAAAEGITFFGTLGEIPRERPQGRRPPTADARPQLAAHRCLDRLAARAGGIPLRL